jgi:hypothetical protein
MTKEQANKIASEHKNKSSAVYVTADGNVFFAETKNFAFHHAKEKNIECFEFTNDELSEAPTAKDEQKTTSKKSK